MQWKRIFSCLIKESTENSEPYQLQCASLQNLKFPVLGKAANSYVHGE